MFKRQFSLLQTVKNALSRSSPAPTPSPTPEVVVQDTPKRVKQQVIYQINTKRPIDNVVPAVESILAKTGTEDKLRLAATIKRETGHRVPDTILNKMSSERDLIKYFKSI